MKVSKVRTTTFNHSIAKIPTMAFNVMNVNVHFSLTKHCNTTRKLFTQNSKRNINVLFVIRFSILSMVLIVIQGVSMVRENLFVRYVPSN